MDLIKAISTLLVCAMLLTGCAAKAPTAPSETAAPDATPDAAQPTATATPSAGATSAPTATPTASPTPSAAPTSTPTASPTAAPTNTPVPTAVPTATPTPVPEKPYVSKHPVSVTVAEGGSCAFEAGYINAIWAVWHFVSPDGNTDLPYDQISSRFPNMQVLYGMYSKMELRNIPLAANGWRVYCRYTNNGGSSDSNWATLTVNAAAPGNFPAAGSYMDSVSMRASMEITGSSSLYNVRIQWGNSAFDGVEWTFSGFFDAGGVMRFTDGAKYNVAYDSAGNGTRTVVYTNASGTLTYSSDGSIAWDDGRGTTGRFVRSAAPTPTPTPVVNEWIETMDLNAAIAHAGVSFQPPIAEALPEGIALDTYRSRPGIIEARYSGGTLIVRKSATLSGSDLSGDYNAYSQSWDHNIKGLAIHCRGNGTNVNETTFSSGEEHYSISFHPGQEGQGLTLDQINSLVNGMY